MTGVTLCYLFIFSSWLLDVMAENASSSVHEAERWGRVLSGIAVALLIWPTIFARTRGRSITAALLAVVPALVIFVVYQGARLLIDTLRQRRM